MKIGFIGYNVVGEHIKYIIEKKYKNIEYLFFDDILYSKNIDNSYPFNRYKEFFNEGINFIVTLGYKHLLLREKIISEILIENESLLNVIDDSAIIPDDVKMGKGVIIYSGIILGNNVSISDGVLLHNGVIVSHDSKIGCSTYISPNATICGNVNVAECCFIGANSSIANDIAIGRECIIGIGSVITTNLVNGTNGIGNPFRILKKKIKLI